VRMVAAGEVGKARQQGGLFFRIGHVFGLRGQEARCFLKAFFVKYTCSPGSKSSSLNIE
jgi:hypothetical protein